MGLHSFWVYILLCENNSYYTGYTNNLEKRYQSHCDGSGGCKYTRSFKPLKIAKSWEVEDKTLALKLERFIKNLTRDEKEQFIKTPNLLLPAFEKAKSDKKTRKKPNKNLEMDEKFTINQEIEYN
ncbi:MAG: GIY-YIG nuclease family protein [Tatlockia sp.]